MSKTAEQDTLTADVSARRNVRTAPARLFADLFVEAPLLEGPECIEGRYNPATQLWEREGAEGLPMVVTPEMKGTTTQPSSTCFTLTWSPGGYLIDPCSPDSD